MDVRLDDGMIVRNVPDGTTQDELMSRLAAAGYQSKEAKTHPILEALGKIDAAPKTQEPGDYQGANYVGQQYKKGVAATLGAPIDALNSVLNLGIAGYGVAKRELTGSNDLPELMTNPVGGSGTFEKLFQTNNDIQPTGPGNRLLGRFVHDMGAAALPVAGIAGRPTSFLPRNPSPVDVLRAQAQGPLPTVAAGGALTALSSAGGELGRAVAPEGYKDYGDMSGQLLGGIAVPSMVMSRLQAAKALKDAANPENTNRLASNYVEGKIQSDVRNFPGARDKLAEALALQDEIPGFQPRIGQASGVPSMMDMERRVATSGPEQFNKRAIQDEANQQAVLRKAEQDLPLLAGKNDIADRLQGVQDERAALAERLPETDAQQTGQTLKAARQSMKGRDDQIAAQKFQAPVQEAERLGVTIDPAGLVAKSKELLANPILQYDQTNAPRIVQNVMRLSKTDGGKPPTIVGPDGEVLSSPKLQSISFADLKALREAVNQDIAQESGGASSNARQRLRGLYDLRAEVDRTAQQAPESVRSLYNDAVSWYRDDYAPKYLRGVNLKQSLKDITGEPRIQDEKLAAQYFKKMGSTPMNRFTTLYGDSPQAMRAMENHILDSYRREVVKDGVIDPKKHEIFTRNYGPALKQLPEIGKGLDSMGNASKLLSEREAQLTETQSLLDAGQLEKLRYNNADGTKGIDPQKIQRFLSKNREPFKEAVSSVYGERVAADHLANLDKIAKASEIIDRGKLSDNAFPAQSTNPLELKSGFGFSGRTVFNMIRAVTTGRTSAEDMAFTLGAQTATHRIGKALIAAEERAISDPQTARLIAESLKQPATSTNGQLTLRKILEKGGLYIANTATGAKNYQTMTKYQAPTFAINATNGDDK